MRSFIYVITDRAGIHARPAGMVVKEAKKYESEIRLASGGNRADAKQLMELMAMGVKCGAAVSVEVSGADEEAAEAAIKAVLENNL